MIGSDHVAASAWTRRFGWVVPSWNTVTEYEVQRLSPVGISNHFARIAHTEDSEAAFERMAREAPGTLDLLVHAGVDAICYACTAGSFFKGFDEDRALAERLTARAGRPVVTMAGALVAAGRSLGFKRISVAAPYEPWLMERLVAFLEAGGFTVLSSSGLGHQANVLYEPGKALELAERSWDPAADGLIMSCGNFRTLEAIESIEDALGRPVVTSVQASLWALMRQSSIDDRIDGAGALLARTDGSASRAGEAH